MRILITGFSGFVSRHFVEYLETNAISATVLGISRSEPTFSIDAFQYVSCTFSQVDLLDRRATTAVIEAFQPEFILHLAAYSSVGFSWQYPSESFANNTNIFLHILEAVRTTACPCRILSVGSSEEYGRVLPEALPLRENSPVNPVSPYAVARVAQEMLSEVYVQGYGLDIMMTRSFNHIGPYQRADFVIASFAKQLVEISQHKSAPILRTGDLSIIRDFVDVRDVVRAYYMLLLNGMKGEIYNICSGQGNSLETLVSLMQKEAGINITIEIDPARIRPNDNPVIIGSAEKLYQTLGWKPEISLRNSIADIIQYWKSI